MNKSIRRSAIFSCIRLFLCLWALFPVTLKSAQSPSESSEQFLRGILEVAKSGDISNPQLIGQKFGFPLHYKDVTEYKKGERHYGLTRRYEAAAADLIDQPFLTFHHPVTIASATGMTQVWLLASINTKRICVTKDDFTRTFGPNIVYGESRDLSLTIVGHKISGPNQIWINADFRDCMLNFDISQNYGRREEK